MNALRSEMAEQWCRTCRVWGHADCSDDPGTLRRRRAFGSLDRADGNSRFVCPLLGQVRSWVAAIFLVALIGCVGAPAHKTLSAAGNAAKHAVDDYYDMVIAGTVRTNDVPRISKMYDDFQKVFRAAQAASEFEPLARADTNVLFKASELLKAVAVAKGAQ